MEAVNGVSEGEKGGPPPPSPLTGCYLLIVIGEPHTSEHKDIILQRVSKGLLSWDVNDCLVDLEKELAIITEQALEGEEARYGERLIQFASENLVTEILIHPVVSTLAQCVRNLLSSFTRHRHIIHAGYTFAANGSWALQDGTFSLADFSEAFQEIEVQRVIRAYENGISLDIHCSPEGDWSRLPKEPFAKNCKLKVNPNDVLTAGIPSINNFINYISPFLVPTSLENLLESSDVVGNIRFSRPTLYVFPGGQGDAALFGINGFNMLLDGGFSRKACFWDFVRHLDRLDAVLMTRLNNSNVNGISSVLKRKKQDAVYPQIGHFFCNILERKSILSPDGDKDKDPLLINLLDEGQEIISNLRHLSLNPQVCYRDSEPINLYHKVGHGTLDMYVLSPAKDSKEVREFLQKWNTSDQKLFANQKSSREFTFPLQNMVSICALLVWQPANPNDTITRILFPGSSPQKKIFEGLDRIKQLEFIKYPVCTEKSLTPASIKSKQKDHILDKVIPTDKKVPTTEKKEKPRQENKHIENNIKNGEVNGVVISEKPVSEKIVKKSDSTDSDKSAKGKKSDEAKTKENGEAPKPKIKSETKPPKARTESQQKKKSIEKKASPTTPKKTVDNKLNGDAKHKAIKGSPSSTPAKSTKDANNRKVIESKIKATPPKKEVSAPKPSEPKAKIERKPISRRPKDAPKPPISPVKKLNGVQKPDSISRKGKLDKEGTTDSSTVSTPSADQESILKKDITKLSPEELQQLKAQELADLKEEQEAVKEIEAVFKKGEKVPEESSNLRKIKDISIDDKLETEEYLIIEKEEIEHDSLDEVKEDETQKLARDSEESEKPRKLSDENLKEIDETKQEISNEKVLEIKEEVSNIVEEAVDIAKSKEASEKSPDDKQEDKKDVEDDNKEVAQESQPDEKCSANVESGATTTAPTLPEDERIPLDEIKEDNGQVVEEKHIKEETKEKDIPVIQLPSKSMDKIPQVVGIRLDKQSHIRDIVKTPDEVADLPVHEEVDIQYNEYQKVDKPEVTEADAKVIEGTGEEAKKVNEKVTDNEVEAKILDDTNKEVCKKELTKSPDEEKDKDEHESEEGASKKSDKEEEKAEPGQQSDDLKKDHASDVKVDPVPKETIDEVTPVEEPDGKLVKTKEEEAKTKPIEPKTIDSPQFKEYEFKHDIKVSEAASKLGTLEDLESINDNEMMDIKEFIEVSSPIIKEHEKKEVQEETIKQIHTRIDEMSLIEDKLNHLKDNSHNVETVSIDHKTEESPLHAEAVIISSASTPDSPKIIHTDLPDKLELGRKSPKEREEDVIKIVSSVAEVLKSDAPLEEFAGKIPFSTYTPYTTELRETHITTVESPLIESKEISTIPEETLDNTKSSTSDFLEQERHHEAIPEKIEQRSSLIRESQELMMATSKIISDIKAKNEDDTDKEDDKDKEDGTVHRMLVTASSEDGGEEIEICPPGTITFSRSSESSGRSSPDIHSQKASQKSSIVDTISESIVTVQQIKDSQSEKDSGFDDKQEEIKKTIGKVDTKDSEPKHEKSEASSGKSTPEVTKQKDIDTPAKLTSEVQEDKASGKSSPELPQDTNDLRKSSLAADAEKTDSGKTSPNKTPTVDSGKTTPEIKDDIGKTISEKPEDKDLSLKSSMKVEQEDKDDTEKITHEKSEVNDLSRKSSIKVEEDNASRKSSLGQLSPEPTTDAQKLKTEKSDSRKGSLIAPEPPAIDNCGKTTPEKSDDKVSSRKSSLGKSSPELPTAEDSRTKSSDNKDLTNIKLEQHDTSRKSSLGKLSPEPLAIGDFEKSDSRKGSVIVLESPEKPEGKDLSRKSSLGKSSPEPPDSGKMAPGSRKESITASGGASPEKSTAGKFSPELIDETIKKETVHIVSASPVASDLQDIEPLVQKISVKSSQAVRTEEDILKNIETMIETDVQDEKHEVIPVVTPLTIVDIPVEKAKETPFSLFGAITSTVGSIIDDTKTALEKCATEIQETVKGEVEAIDNNIQDMIDKTKESKGEIEHFLEDKKKELVTKASDEVRKIDDKIEDTIHGVTGSLQHTKKSVDQLKDNILEREETLGHKFTDKMEDTKAQLAGVKDSMKEHTDKVTSSIEELGKTMADDTSEKAKDLKTEILTSSNDLLSKMAGGLTSTITGATDALKDTLTGLTDVVTKEKGDVKGLEETGDEKIDELEEAITKSKYPIKEDAKDNLEDAVGEKRSDIENTGESIKDIISKTGEEISSTVGGFAANLVGGLKDITDSFKEDIKDVKDAASQKVTEIKEAKESTTDVVVQSKDEISDFLKHEVKYEAVDENKDDLKEDIKETVGATKDTVFKTKEDVSSFSSNLVNDIEGVADSINVVIDEKINVVGEQAVEVKECISKTTLELEETVAGSTDNVAETKEESSKTIGDFTSNILSGIKDVAKSIKDDIKDLIESGDEKSDAVSKKVEEVEETVETIKDAKTKEKLSESLKHEVKELKEAMDEKKDTLKEIISEKTSIIKDVIAKPEDQVSESSKQELKELKELMYEKKDTLKEIISETTSLIKDAIDKTGDEVSESIKQEVKDVKKAMDDSQDETISEKTSVIKDAIDKTKDEVSDSIKNELKDLKETVDENKYALGEALNIKTSEIKDDIAKTKDEVLATIDIIEPTKSVDEKQVVVPEVNEIVESTKDTVAKTKDELSESIRQEVKDVKETLVEQKDSLDEAVTDKTSEVKDDVSKTKEKVLSSIGDFTSNSLEDIKDIAEHIKKEHLTEAADEKKDAVSEKLSEVKDGLSDKVKDVKKAGHEKEEKVSSTIGDFTSSLLSDIKDVSDLIKEDIKDITESADEKKEVVSEKISEVKDAVDSAKGTIAQTKEKLSDSVKQDVKEVNESVVDKKDTLKDAVTEKTSEYKDVVAETKEEVSNTIGEFTSSLLGGIKGVTESITEGIKDIVESSDKKKDVSEKTSEVTDTLQPGTDAFSETNEVCDSIKKKIEDGGEALDEKKYVLENVVTEKSSEVKDAIVNTKEETCSTIGGFTSTLFSAIKDTAESIKEDIKDLVESTDEKKDIVSDISSDIQDGAKNIFVKTKDDLSDSINQESKDVKEVLDEKEDAVEKAVIDKTLEVKDAVAKTKGDLTIGAFTSNLVGGIKAATDVIKEDIKDLQEKAEVKKEVIDEKTSEVKDALESTKEAVAKRKDELTDMIGQEIKDVKESVDQKKYAVKETFDSTKEAMGGLVDGVRGATDSIKEDIKKTADDALKKKSSELTDIAADNIKDLTASIKQDIKDAKELAEEKKDELKDVINEKMLDVKDAIGKADEKLSSTVDSFKDGVTDIKASTDNKKTEVKDVVSGIVNDIQDVTGTIKEDTSKQIDDIKINAEEFEKTIISTVDDLSSSILGGFKSLSEGVKDTVDKKIEESKTIVDDNKEVITKDAKTALEDFRDSMKTTKDDIGDKLEKGVIDTLESTKDEVADLTASILGGIQHFTDTIRDDGADFLEGDKPLLPKDEVSKIDSPEEKPKKSGGFFSNLISSVESTFDDIKKSVTSDKQDKEKHVDDQTHTKTEIKENLAQSPDKESKKDLDADIDESKCEVEEICIKKHVTNGLLESPVQKSERGLQDLLKSVHEVENLVEASKKYDEKISETTVPEKETEEDLVDEIKDVIHSVTSIFTPKSDEADKIIEQSATDLTETFDTISDMSKSVIFEKCGAVEEIPPEELDKATKLVEKCADDLKETFETVSDLTKTSHFDKCKELGAAATKTIEASAKDLSDTYDTVADMSKSVVFEKVEPDTILDKSNKDLAETFDAVTDMSKSIIFEKIDKDKPESVETVIEKCDKFKNEISPAPKATDVNKDDIKTDKLDIDEKEIVGIHLLQVQKSDEKKLSISDVDITFDNIDKSLRKDLLDSETQLYEPSSSTDEADEKHIHGRTTPPTVPVSPQTRDLSPSFKSESKKPSNETLASLMKETDGRSCTPVSDDFEVVSSAHSDVSSSQFSRAPYASESERADDDDDDIPGSPLSITSQVAHSRSSSHYDFDEDANRIAKIDPMNMSFYGALPDEPDEDDAEDILPSHLYEITKAKYSIHSEEDKLDSSNKLDQLNKNGAGTDTGTSTDKTTNLMTSSFIGELPTSTQSGDTKKKDPFESWGKPLGLPSPAPPDNKGTPKKERKLPPNVTAKNKLNDDKKRSESPSKYKNKKLNPVYVDLTYVPHHGNSYYSYVDFFKRVRARYYVFSGIEPSRDVYNALLEAKQTWEDKELEVTIIPTYDTDILGYWVAENEELLIKHKIDLSPSASRCTINLQDHETSCSAYRLEF